MKNCFLISILCLLNILDVYCQQFDQICRYSENENESIFLNCLTQKKENQTNNIISEVTKVSNISNNFTLINCDQLQNACAVINPLNNNKRYILFDYHYFQNIYHDDAASVFILAHEVGHHINGHTIPTNETIGEKRTKELEADYFAGSIMYKLGYSENRVFNILNKLPNTENQYSTHPSGNVRLEYALKGFFSEKNRIYSIVEESEKRHSDKFQKESNNQKYIDLKLNLKKFDLSGDIKYLNIAEYLIDQIQFENNSSDLDITKAFIYKHSNNFQKAQNLYLKILRKNIDNEDALIDLLEIASNDLNSTDKKDLEYFISLIEKKSSNPKFFLNTSIYYRRVGNYTKFMKNAIEAYNLIKNDNESLLQSDILLHYGRALYDEETKEALPNFSFCKSLFKKSLAIVEKYPKDSEYYYYYDVMLFHLGNISKYEASHIEAINYYKKLLGNTARIDYKYKLNFALYEIYISEGKLLEGTQSITNAINLVDDIELKSFYLYRRGILYAHLENFELATDDFIESCKMGFTEACKVIMD